MQYIYFPTIFLYTSQEKHLTFLEARIVCVVERMLRFSLNNTVANGVQLKVQEFVDKEETYVDLLGSRRGGIGLDEVMVIP